VRPDTVMFRANLTLAAYGYWLGPDPASGSVCTVGGVIANDASGMCADPDNILAPGILLSDDPQAHLHHLHTTPTMENEIDRCIECGYCEPVCPSRNLTTTPRQRIVLRREMIRQGPVNQ
jgi:ferredoxin